MRLSEIHEKLKNMVTSAGYDVESMVCSVSASTMSHPYDGKVSQVDSMTLYLCFGDGRQIHVSGETFDEAFFTMSVRLGVASRELPETKDIEA